MQTTHLTIHKAIDVEAPVQRAWDTFTAGIASWWPVTTHSIGGQRVRDVVLEPREGGLVYEVLDDGTRHEWADVVTFDPPECIVLNWRVNPQRAATSVEVRFGALEGGRTRVELTHSGFDAADSYESYEAGWDPVLARFAASS